MGLGYHKLVPKDRTYVIMEGKMKQINDASIMTMYIQKNNIDEIFGEDLVPTMRLYRFEKGEFILHAGDELEVLYMLVKGKVKVTYDFENGKSVLLKFYRDFSAMGDLELIQDRNINCHVEAVESSEFIAIPIGPLRKKIQTDSVLLMYLARSLSEKLNATINNSAYNYVYPLINRMASYLQEYVEGDQPQYITMNETYKDIACFLATTYRHLNRTMKELEEMGIIRIEKRLIYVMNPSELRALAVKEYLGY